MMGKLYEEWMKEVKVDLTTHSRRADDTVPPVLLNFPAHSLAPKLVRVTVVAPTNDRQLVTTCARGGHP
jgi:hypothetical protein